MSGVANPIRYSDISRYAVDHELPLEETVDLVQQLDATYFRVTAAASKKQRAHQQKVRQARQ